jgi:hypothetical protein
MTGAGLLVRRFGDPLIVEGRSRLLVFAGDRMDRRAAAVEHGTGDPSVGAMASARASAVGASLRKSKIGVHDGTSRAAPDR